MLQKLLDRLRRDKKGQGLVEYALLIAGVALIAAAAVSTFGHKTSDLISAVATILPGAHTGDNGPIQSGHLIETGNTGTNNSIALDTNAILSGNGQARLGQNVLGPNEGAANGFAGLVVESK
jgi:pilus assembly protein Flp/PilA